MAGRHQYRDAILRYHLHRQFRLVDLAFHETQVRPALDHGPRHALRIADGETELDLRIALAELHQQRRQPVAGDGLAGVDAQRAPFQAAQFGQRQLGAASHGQRGLRLGQEDAARFAQFDAAPHPVEQRRAVTVFQRADGGADGRWRERQRAGRLRQVLPLGDGDENP